MDSSKVFFTSDLHLGHKNIIEFSERPFSSIETMDTALIRNWNSVVPTDGIVFLLGDFSFHNAQHSKVLLKQLNGRIILIKGNHDKCTSYFKEVHELLDIKVLDNVNGNFGGFTHITLCHYPLAIWNKKGYGSFHFFGHSHGSYTNIGHTDHHDYKYNRSIDVGVDCWNYKPICYTDLIKEILKNEMGSRT